MRVENLTNDRGNKAVNQFVITTENGVFFQSYDSMICKYVNGQVYVTPLWDYSNTTRKHFYIFLRDYCRMGRMLKNDILDAIRNGSIEEVAESELELVGV